MVQAAAENARIEKAQRKLNKFEAELEGLRAEYQDVQKRQKAELRQLEKQAAKVSERIKQGQVWIEQQEKSRE